MTKASRTCSAALAIGAGLALIMSSAQAQTRIEQTSPSVSYTAGWDQDSSKSWSGGTAATTSAAGAQATLSFSGTSASWVGGRGPWSGIARVLVDGQLAAYVDTYSKTEEIRVPMYTVNDLADGNHTLTIEATGTMNPAATSTVIAIDAFDVPGPAVSRLQETDPDVGFSAGWVQDNPVVTLIPGVTTGRTQGTSIRSWSAGAAAISSTAGATATFHFKGTAVSWVGARGTQSGIARVSLDGGAPATVDLYSPQERIQAEVYRASGLADAAHTLTIEATGTQNPAAQGALVVVDAFEVTAPGKRYQETDPAISYGSGWIQGNRDKAYSEGTTAETITPGAQATFSFNGTGVRWIGARGPQTGMARVYLDGSFVTDVDAYAMTEGPQHTMYEAENLAPGAHTLAVQVLPQNNPASTDHWILIDAFDVIP